MADDENTVSLQHPNLDSEKHIVRAVVRVEDKMINATKMYQDTDKRLKTFYNQPSFKTLSETVPENTKLVSATPRGTWMHPLAAIEYAKWISPDYCRLFLETLLNSNSNITVEIERTKILETKLKDMESQIQAKNVELQTLQLEAEEKIKAAEDRAKVAEEKCAVAVARYDEQIGFEAHWNTYKYHYRTIYDYVRERYKVDMKESTFKKVQAEVIKKRKAREEESNFPHTLFSIWEKYHHHVSRCKPLNPKYDVPPPPEPPKHFKKTTPHSMKAFHSRDWDLIENCIDMYINDPSVFVAMYGADR